MTSPKWCRLIVNFVTPYLRSHSTVCSSSGRPATGTMHLGTACVISPSRVPLPAASSIAVDGSEFQNGNRAATPSIKHTAFGALIFHYQHVGTGNILYIDVVPQLHAVFITDWWKPVQESQREAASDTGVGVIERIA